METIEKDGMIYPLLRADAKGYINCIFCQQKHKHGGEDGHRIPHCSQEKVIDPIILKNNLFRKQNGYFIKFV